MYYIGVDVGGTNLVAGLMNEDCEILDKASHLVDHSQTPEQLCGESVRLAKQVCQSGGVTKKEGKAVGSGLPSTSILSVSASALMPRIAAAPLTLTRPAFIHSSAALRDISPEAEIIF